MATALPNVICVSAPSRYSGKGTVANVLLREYGYTLMQFSASLKVMWSALAIFNGLPQDIVTRSFSKDLKEQKFDECGGLSYREFCEGVGTDWGRDMYDKQLWGKIGRNQLNKLIAAGKRVVVEDCRFPNEADICREVGGKVVNVIRPVFNGGLAPTLVSEGHMTGYTFDWTFENTGSIQNLEEQVRWYLNPLVREYREPTSA